MWVQNNMTAEAWLKLNGNSEYVGCHYGRFRSLCPSPFVTPHVDCDRETVSRIGRSLVVTVRRAAFLGPCPIRRAKPKYGLIMFGINHKQDSKAFLLEPSIAPLASCDEKVVLCLSTLSRR